MDDQSATSLFFSQEDVTVQLSSCCFNLVVILCCLLLILFIPHLPLSGCIELEIYTVRWRRMEETREEEIVEASATGKCNRCQGWKREKVRSLSSSYCIESFFLALGSNSRFPRSNFSRQELRSSFSTLIHFIDHCISLALLYTLTCLNLLIIVTGKLYFCSFMNRKKSKLYTFVLSQMTKNLSL